MTDCGRCHACGATLVRMAEGPEWCAACRREWRLHAHGWRGLDGEPGSCQEEAAERRKSSRFPVKIPVRLTVAGTAQTAWLRDVCRDAAMVEAREALPVDTVVIVAMELPGTGGPLVVTGRVIRLAPGEAGDQGMAILFTEVSDSAATRLDFFAALQDQH